MKIPVIWWNCEQQRGSWACTFMLNQMFDGYDCTHYSKLLAPIPTDLVGGVIVFHGGNAQLHGQGGPQADAMSEFIQDWDWAIFVNIGDEQSEFPTHYLDHPNMKLWLQTPLPSQRADRYLVEGYTSGTQNMNIPRSLDWFFAGQDNHVRRHQMRKSLNKIKKGSAFYSEGFGQGMNHRDYIYYLNLARVVPCPSGPATPDSFRLYEALECGAVPIVDMVSLNPATRGFWDVVLPSSPLTFIDDWSTLPSVMEEILADYERHSRLVQHWWKGYKLAFRQWLKQDLGRLGAV